MQKYPKPVGIIEDNISLKSNIADYINLSDQYFSVFDVSSIENLNNLKISVKPKIILLDIHLNDGNSLNSLNILLRKFPETYFLIMTGDMNDKNILKALENGAKGYINKPFEMEELIKAMDKIFQDGSFLTPLATTSLLKVINDNKKPSSSIQHTYSLTMKENEIVVLLRQALSYNEIAEKLKISYHTVNHHIKNIYNKMDINSKSKLIAEINKDFKNS
ncbi:MAG: response regulator transcription factor [Bacteroidetes bacterium]|nr:response regulator transcription factor [Bacteroidota bacterium]